MDGRYDLRRTEDELRQAEPSPATGRSGMDRRTDARRREEQGWTLCVESALKEPGEPSKREPPGSEERET